MQPDRFFAVRLFFAPRNAALNYPRAYVRFRELSFAPQLVLDPSLR
jgi:hypothetical protein